MSGLGRSGWVRVFFGAALVAGVFALLAVHGFRQERVEAQFSPAAGTGPGLPETIEAIDTARVTTRILYIDAHPDDESAAVLTYLARGLHADVALLSLTRGEGGQNDLGPEQNPQLGLIRTQELLAATRGYGVKLFFTRARDFGFSKTPEETQKIWGDQVLEDMVRVIRTFRPNVVVNNFGNVHSGHGHHQAAGLLTPKAVAAAADAKMYSELKRDGLKVWSAGTAGCSDHGSGSRLGITTGIFGSHWRYFAALRQVVSRDRAGCVCESSDARDFGVSWVAIFATAGGVNSREGFAVFEGDARIGFELPGGGRLRVGLWRERQAIAMP